MREVIETMFFTAAMILTWGKLISVILCIAALMYGIYRTQKFVEKMRMVRSYDTCQ